MIRQNGLKGDSESGSNSSPGGSGGEEAKGAVDANEVQETLADLMQVSCYDTSMRVLHITVVGGLLSTWANYGGYSLPGPPSPAPWFGQVPDSHATVTHQRQATGRFPRTVLLSQPHLLALPCTLTPPWQMEVRRVRAKEELASDMELKKEEMRAIGEEVGGL